MAAFSTNPDVLSSIAALSSATWAYAGLSAAFELGIVRALDAPASAEELGSRLDLEPTLVADLLGVLIPLGAVERRGDRYALTAEFEPFRSGSMAKVMRAGVRSDHLQTADALRRARDGEEICALYVSERANGRGVGRVLLGDAKRRSDRLRLRVLEANEWAQRFYQRQGFVESGRGDGAENDENMPDIVYVWTKEVLS